MKSTAPHRMPGLARALCLALALAALCSGGALAAPGGERPAASPPATGTAAPKAAPRAAGVKRGVVAPLGKAAACALAPAATGAPRLAYHGGATMHTDTAYAVFWLPAGSVVSANYQSLLSGFLQNVAAAGGAGSTVYAVPTQYWDFVSGNILDGAAYGGSFVDTTPLPAGGCADRLTAACLTDAQLQAELGSAIAAAGWSAAPTHLFFLFTARGVGTCFDSTNGYCAYTDFCAYHSDFPLGGAQASYAVMPYAASPAGCDEGSAYHPNGDDADATINLLSHEHIGALTDFNADGWYDDASGDEAGDECAWSFGAALGSTPSGRYNQVVGGGKYWLQQEWSNADGACALGDTPPPAVAGVSPASWSSAGSTGVAISGSRFTGATAVHFGPSIATSFTVNSDSGITAVAPAGLVGPPVDVTVTGPGGTSAAYAGDGYSYTQPANPAGGPYNPLTPARIFDTRLGQFAPALQPGQTRTVQVTGQGGVPSSGVTAVVVNVAVTNPTAQSYLTLFPAGAARPNTATLDFLAGQTIPNLAEVAVGSGGQMSVYNILGTVDVILDVQGWVGPAGLYHTLPPARIFDSRQAPYSPALGPGGTRNAQVTGQGGVPATGVSAVVLNVTATDTTAGSYLTVFPAGQAAPGTSNLNWAQGQTAVNRVIVPVGTNGQVALYNPAGSVDVVGYFS